jgi:transcriptional regulator with XRE-family HTH domain
MKQESIGEVLKRLRIEKGYIRQSHLAETLPISAATISRIEKDKQIPSPDTLKQFADVLNVSLDYLFEICGYNFLRSIFSNSSASFIPAYCQNVRANEIMK